MTEVNENIGEGKYTDDEPENVNIKPEYEVVFYVKYNTRNQNKPSEAEITSYFNNYGKVHHVIWNEYRNYVFVFMESLNTQAEFQRTKSTISKIIEDMTPENKFYVTVARNKNENFDRNRNDYRDANQFRGYRNTRGNYRGGYQGNYRGNYRGYRQGNYRGNYNMYDQNDEKFDVHACEEGIDTSCTRNNTRMLPRRRFYDGNY